VLSPIFYLNGFLTVSENIFSVIGYLPKNKFPSLHTWAVTWRRNQGKIQLITGLGLLALGYSVDFLIPSLNTGSYMSLPLQTASIGLLLANHGAFNIIRSHIEKINFQGISLLYDFYGRKVLPALNPRFDFLELLFSKVKNLMDRIIFVSLFPPQFVFTR